MNGTEEVCEFASGGMNEEPCDYSAWLGRSSPGALTQSEMLTAKDLDPEGLEVCAIGGGSGAVGPSRVITSPDGVMDTCDIDEAECYYASGGEVAFSGGPGTAALGGATSSRDSFFPELASNTAGAGSPAGPTAQRGAVQRRLSASSSSVMAEPQKHLSGLGGHDDQDFGTTWGGGGSPPSSQMAHPSRASCNRSVTTEPQLPVPMAPAGSRKRSAMANNGMPTLAIQHRPPVPPNSSRRPIRRMTDLA